MPVKDKELFYLSNDNQIAKASETILITPKSISKPSICFKISAIEKYHVLCVLYFNKACMEYSIVSLERNIGIFRNLYTCTM